LEEKWAIRGLQNLNRNLQNSLSQTYTLNGHVGFVVDKVALEQVFSEYFGFQCQFSFHQMLHCHHHLSSGAGTIDHTVAEAHPTPRN
jgi:hypothetical protein